MIPVSTLYDEYIDRPELSEQKNPFEYIVPPRPLQRGRNNNFFWNNSLFLLVEKCSYLLNSAKF